MSLADLYQDIVNAEPGLVQNCKTCAWYSQLDENDKSFFDQKAYDYLDTGEGLSALRKTAFASGLQIARTSFDRHLREHHKNVVSANYGVRVGV